MTISDVFERTRMDNKFSLYMSSFGHVFLDAADAALVRDEPPFYVELPAGAYVFAAGFVHYWCDVFMLRVPDWVHGTQYRLDAPYCTVPFMREEIERLTPTQFAVRNYFIPSTEVIYL